MKTYFQFITTPTSDTQGTCLALHTPKKTFVFGHAGEGLQRAAVQQGFRTAKVGDIFLSGRAEWKTLGGLLGFLITSADTASTQRKALADQKVAKKGGIPGDDGPTAMTLWGPVNLNYMLSTARKFVFRTSLRLRSKEVSAFAGLPGIERSGSAALVMRDESVSVWGLPVFAHQSSPANTRKRSHDQFTGRANPEVPDFVGGSEPVRRAVQAMFESDWKPDKLEECSINDVEFPAKVFIRDSVTKDLRPYLGPFPTTGEPVTEVKVLVRRPWPATTYAAVMPPTTPIEQSVSYIVLTQPVRGKFNIAKANTLDISDKRKYAQLVDGQTVINDKGQEITPEMVLGPSTPSIGAVIADLPSSEYVRSFIDEINAVGSEIRERITTYVWILGPGVVSHPELQEFLDRYGQHKHIISSADVCHDRSTFDSATGSLARFAKLDPSRYTPAYIDETARLPVDKNLQPAQRALCCSLDGDGRVEKDLNDQAVDIDAFIKTIPADALVASEQAKETLENTADELDKWAETFPHSDAEVITLGTGSALPSPHRNVSANLIRIPKWGNVLLDSGENTIGQLKRAFPPEEYLEVMRNLRLVWISHLHADHHLGLASILKERYRIVHNSVPDSLHPNLWTDPEARIPEDNLVVVAGVVMHRWISEYSQMEDIGYSRITPVLPDVSGAPSRLFVPPSGPFGSEPGRAINPRDIGLRDLAVARVLHCNGAMAVAITFPSYFKLAYSGDCRPSKHFVRIGQDATVCIHEATFDDELQGEAVAKRHSTVSEAVGVAAAMKAKTLVLTHFSQRYAKLPVLKRDATTSGMDIDAAVEDEEMDDDEPIDAILNEPEQQAEESQAGVQEVKTNTDLKIAAANDLMRLKVRDIPQLQYFVPALVKLQEGDEARKAAEREFNRQAMDAARSKKAKNKSAKQSGQKGDSSGQLSRKTSWDKRSDVKMEGVPTTNGKQTDEDALDQLLDSGNGHDRAAVHANGGK